MMIYGFGVICYAIWQHPSNKAMPLYGAIVSITQLFVSVGRQNSCDPDLLRSGIWQVDVFILDWSDNIELKLFYE
jgi:hypothetical protein